MVRKVPQTNFFFIGGGESLFKVRWPNIIYFVFLGPHLWYMEIPRLGVESELQLLACTTATATQESEPHLRPTPQLMATLGP